MNIEQEGYTREQIINALFSSARQVRYEFTLSNAADEYIGMIEVENAVITFDSTSEVMRTFTGSVSRDDLLNMDSIDYRITAWMCLMMPNKKEIKWALGKFIVIPSMSYSNGLNHVNISGFDLSKIALDDKTSLRIYVDDTTIYTSAISQLLREMYTNVEIEETSLTKSFSQEWDLNESKLTIINDLLKGINYNPLYFDENGKCICKPYVLESERNIDFQYIANQTSVIVDGIELISDKFDIPNKWIRYTENPDAPYLISVYENDNPESPYSTVNRHRTIVNSEAVNDIANIDVLNAYVRKIAASSMQSTNTLTFSTLNIPGHGLNEMLWVEIPSYGIFDRYVEEAWEMELKTGGRMQHRCKKVVVL